MRNQRSFAMRCGVPILMLTILAGSLAAADKKKVKKNDFCAQPNPQSLCTAENTCGAGGCTLDVTRTSSSSSLKPITAGSKSDKPICVAAGTKVEFTSTEKETGFIVDQGTGSPFEPAGAIIGGSTKSVPVVATKEGCYSLSYGACKSGAIYGMCQENSATIIVTKGK
jgi:hypothetical protein